VSVVLRRASRSDAEFLLELITGDDTREFLGGGVSQTLDDVIRDIDRSEREPERYGWLVADADGERVGSAAY